MKKAIYSMLPCITLLTSCATIMHGPRQSVGISSNPANAQIWVDNQYMGQTPLIVEMSRKDNHYVRLEIEGYLPYEMNFTRQMNGWVFGNLAFGAGCIIGIAVDAISGGIYRLTPEQVEAQMISNNVYYSKRGPVSYVSIVMEVDPSWEKIGELVTKN